MKGRRYLSHPPKKPKDFYPMDFIYHYLIFLGEGVAKVYMPILVPVGVVGNVLSFLV